MKFYIYSKKLNEKIKEDVLNLLSFSYIDINTIEDKQEYLLVEVDNKNEDIEQMLLSYSTEFVTNLTFGFIRNDFVCNINEILNYLNQLNFNGTKMFNDNDYLIDVIFNDVNLKKEYTRKLDKIVTNDKPLVLLVRNLIENSLNYSRTAIKNYLHRNTLINKMKRFENLTKFNLRDFKDSYIIYTLLN